MADVDVKSFESLQGASTTIQSGLRHLQVAGSTLNSNPFAGLAACNPDLITPYINVLAEALTATYDLANKSYNALETYIAALTPKQEETPETPADENPTNPGGTNPSFIGFRIFE